MKQIDVKTDKEIYSGILLHEEHQSASDFDIHDWYNERYTLLTKNGIVNINHYVNDIELPICDCEECMFLHEEQPNCDYRTCPKCNGSSKESWIIKTIVSKEEIIEFLNK